MSGSVLDLVDAEVHLESLSLPHSERADAPCGQSCAFRKFLSTHHDSLLMVTDSLDSALDLLELAVTWEELDYSEKRLIGPSQWDDFLAAHHWKDTALAERVFGLAADIARQGRRR